MWSMIKNVDLYVEQKYEMDKIIKDIEFNPPKNIRRYKIFHNI
jgi:hypothetical protein